MARKILLSHVCDECGVEENTELENSRYIPDDEIPEGWGFVTISLNVSDECKCACHKEECDDEGDNLAGHEDYDCEVCPEDDDERWVATLCRRCVLKAMSILHLPKRNETL